MSALIEIIRRRCSSRTAFDPVRKISVDALQMILEAARWAPTAHNMQNFEILVVDDEALLARIAAIETETSQAFLSENYDQLSFSEEELKRKGIGLLASMFPPAWRTPDASPASIADTGRSTLGAAMQGCPLLLVILFDPRKRAPASESDTLGLMSLGCVMENMWLMAEELGISFQILSAFNAQGPKNALHALLNIPAPLKIAFACRLGYPAETRAYLRVRRPNASFVHHNRFGGTALSLGTSAETPCDKLRSGIDP